MTIIDLQTKFHQWHKHNFPNATWDEPLMGMVEEMGELHHALLKQKQGIRGTFDHHEGKAKDAIGDMMVFMMHFLNLKGWDLEMIMLEVYNEVSKRDWVKFPKNGINE